MELKLPCNITTPPFVTNIVFGLGEFKEDGKPGENFLSRAHKIHPPKLGGKCWREKCSHSTFMKIPCFGIKLKKKKKKIQN